MIITLMWFQVNKCDIDRLLERHIDKQISSPSLGLSNLIRPLRASNIRYDLNFGAFNVYHEYLGAGRDNDQCTWQVSRAETCGDCWWRRLHRARVGHTCYPAKGLLFIWIWIWIWIWLWIWMILWMILSYRSLSCMEPQWVERTWG